MSENCLFCGQLKKGYKPPVTVDFICGSCVQLLLVAEQSDLRRGYEKAVRLGYTGKAEAIKTFIVEEPNAETEEPERSMVRERFVQAVGFTRDQVRPQPSA